MWCYLFCCAMSFFLNPCGLQCNLHVCLCNALGLTSFQATALYKLVAERGPWSSLSRWSLEAYLKGDVGKAFLLYSRMAELGYEVAQSNAAWILDKYGEKSMCMGESGFCTDAERHQRAHSLWWQASEQGNEHAALLIGDAYYYGRVGFFKTKFLFVWYILVILVHVFTVHT